MQRTKSKRLMTAASSCGLIVTLIVLLSGCGGSGTSDAFSNLPPGASVGGGGGGGGAASFVGRSFTSTLDLGSGRSGVLNMTVGAGGALSGTLTVSDAVNAFRAISRQTVLGAFIIAFTGDLDLLSGAFDISGRATSPTGTVIPFTASGTLPKGTGVGSYTAVLSGQTYTGVIQAGTTNTGGGGTGGGTGTVQVGTINFSNVSNTNGKTATITKSIAAAAFSNNVLNASLTESGSQAVERNLSIQVGASDLASVTVGKTYPIQTAGGNPANGSAVVGYIEGQDLDSKFWFANGGSVVVDARSGNTITLRVVNATMRPVDNNAGSSIQPTGTFTINAAGQFTVR